MRRLDDKYDGVYIRIGEQIFFRRAEPVFEIDDYYIIRAESEKEKTENAALESDSSGEAPKKTYKYLALYDNVIVGGKELYDGKRIN